jgi:hypothetical protein
MKKNYYSKIIAKDIDGLQLISAYCAGAKIKVSDIKYLPKNKVFIISLRRTVIEKNGKESMVNSICKFEFIDSVKAKNIDQNKEESVLELLTIDLLKRGQKFEITLIFSNNAYIILSTEIVESTLEDQNQKK